MLLHVGASCCMLVHVVVCCCILLHVVVCYCILLHVVVKLELFKLPKPTIDQLSHVTYHNPDHTSAIRRSFLENPKISGNLEKSQKFFLKTPKNLRKFSEKTPIPT